MMRTQSVTLLPLCLSLFCVSSAAMAESLAQAVNAAFVNNPSLLSAKQGEYIAYGTMRSAETGFLPTLSVNIGSGPSYTKSSTTGENGVNLIMHENSMSLSQKIFAGGKTLNLMKQRYYEWQAERQRYQGTRSGLAADVVDAYLDILRYQQLEKLSRENVAVHEKFMKMLQKRYRGGAGPKVDVELAAGRMARAQTRYISAVNNLQSAKVRYKTLTGLTPHLLQVPANVRERLPDSKQQAIRLAFVNSNANRAAQHDLQAAKHEVKVAEGAFAPEVSFDVSATDNWNLAGTVGPNRARSFMLNFSYDVFNGGKDYIAYHQSKHTRMQAAEDLRESQNQVLQDVTLAWDELEMTRKHLEQSLKYFKMSKSVLDGYSEEFKLGRRSLLNLLDVEDEAYSAHVSLINDIYDNKQNAYTLLSTVGTIVETVLDEREK